MISRTLRRFGSGAAAMRTGLGVVFFSFFPPTVLKRLTYFEASEALIRQFRCDQFVVRSWHMLCCRNICVNELPETRP
jgi:hypothetical protein